MTREPPLKRWKLAALCCAAVFALAACGDGLMGPHSRGDLTGSYSARRMLLTQGDSTIDLRQLPRADCVTFAIGISDSASIITADLTQHETIFLAQHLEGQGRAPESVQVDGVWSVVEGRVRIDLSPDNTFLEELPDETTFFLHQMEFTPGPEGGGEVETLSGGTVLRDGRELDLVLDRSIPTCPRRG